MGIDWISKPLACNGVVFSSGLEPSDPLVPIYEQIALRIRLVMKSVEMRACERRQLSLHDIEQMGYYQRWLSECQNVEEELRMLVRHFGSDYARHLSGESVDLDVRALNWARQD